MFEILEIRVIIRSAIRILSKFVMPDSARTQVRIGMKGEKMKKEEKGLKHKNIAEKENAWERRLQEIADVLKLENDLQFQRIIENLPFSLNITTLEGQLVYANPKCLELFELDAGVVGTQTTLDFWVEEGKRDLWLESP